MSVASTDTEALFIVSESHRFRKLIRGERFVGEERKTSFEKGACRNYSRYRCSGPGVTDTTARVRVPNVFPRHPGLYDGLPRKNKLFSARRFMSPRFVASLKCQRGDSNPYGFLHQILSLARLPISPPWLVDY